MSFKKPEEILKPFRLNTLFSEERPDTDCELVAIEIVQKKLVQNFIYSAVYVSSRKIPTYEPCQTGFYS